jgi:hypothetical protein
MSDLIRTLLVCLLALALPVQGALAATRVVCAAHHPGGVSVGAEGGTAVTPAHAHHDAGMHSGTHAGAAAAAPGADSAASAAEPAQATAGGKCSACSACCAPGLMPTPASGLPAAEPAPTVFAAVEFSVEAFAADGPDRPPRTTRV